MGSEPGKLAELVGGNKQVAVVANALDFSADLERKDRSVRREIDALSELGLVAEQLDLRDYFGAGSDLRERLSKYGVMWVMGGNSFILRRAMRQSGLDVILEGYRALRGGREFVYAGYSAGIVVVAPTLRGIELMDDPEVIPDRYDAEIVWDGLGFVTYSLVPHYRSDHPESGAADIAARYFRDNGIGFKAIRDGEVIIEHV